MAFRSRAGALLSMAVALLLAVTGCGTTLSALAGHSSSAPAASAGPFTLLQEPEAGLTPLRDIISAATKSVKFCIYELADPATEDALIASRNRGVQVQVLLDTAFHGQEANAAAYDKLSAAGVDVRWAPQDTILHEKSLTTDGTRSAIGTGNAQAKFMATSRDFWIIDTDPGDVAAAAATFDQDFTGHVSQAVPGPHLVWSPGARQTVIARIDAARNTLMATSEELTDRPTAKALERAATRGVPCRIILPAGANNTQTIAAVARAGCQIHHTSAQSDALYMHSKVLVTDGQSPDGGDTVLVGSINLSTKSLTEDRELAVLLDSRTAGPIVAAIESTFEKDFAATAG